MPPIARSGQTKALGLFAVASALTPTICFYVSTNETAIAAPVAGFEDGEFPPRFDCKARCAKRFCALRAFAAGLPRRFRASPSIRLSWRNWQRYLYPGRIRFWDSGWRSCPASRPLLHSGLRRRLLRLCRDGIADCRFSGVGRLPHPVHTRARAPRASSAQTLFRRARSSREHLIARARAARFSGFSWRSSRRRLAQFPPCHRT
jgi:hypothetical protein